MWLYNKYRQKEKFKREKRIPIYNLEKIILENKDTIFRIEEWKIFLLLLYIRRIFIWAIQNPISNHHSYVTTGFIEPVRGLHSEYRGTFAVYHGLNQNPFRSLI